MYSLKKICKSNKNIGFVKTKRTDRVKQKNGADRSLSRCGLFFSKFKLDIKLGRCCINVLQ